MKTNNLTYENHTITQALREEKYGQKACILWFTGLSASGKSTLANGVEKKLFEMGYYSYILDGDNMRLGLNNDLGFSQQDRTENIRRVGEVAKLFVDSGFIVLSAFISPFIQDRKCVRALVKETEFIEIFIDTPLEICELRDPKGLYKKARNGEIKDFTGIDSPYEIPKSPEIHICNAHEAIATSINTIIDYLSQHGYLSAR